MALRGALLRFKAERDKWEDRLILAVTVFCVGAVVCNLGLFFSVRKTPSFLGAAFSWLYVVTWLPAALLARERGKWVRRLRRVRLLAVGAIVLGIVAGAGGGMGVVSGLCVMPYAVVVSVYAGLAGAAWVSYALPLAQAVIASGLVRRLRKKEEKGPYGGR